MPQETGAFVCSILISRMVSEFAINKNVLSLREEVKFSGGRIVVKCIVRHDGMTIHQKLSKGLF